MRVTSFWEIEGKKMKETFDSIIHEYIPYLKARGRRIHNVKLSLKLFNEYLERTEVDFRYVKIRHAQDFQTYLCTMTDVESRTHYSKGSVQNFIGCVSSFYNYLRSMKVVHSNPFLEVKRVRTEKALPKNILNEEDMNRLLSYLKHFGKGDNMSHRRTLYKAHVAIELMYSTGARINEIMKLVPADLDFTRGTVRITDSKSSQIRDGILNSFTEKVLRIYVEEMRDYVLFGKNNGDRNLLFGSKDNLRMWLNDVLEREGKKLGLDKLTNHHFRHAVGYHLLRGGCDIRFIQEILGHKLIHSTQVYTKVDKEDLKSVLDEYHPRTLRNSQS